MIKKSDETEIHVGGYEDSFGYESCTTKEKGLAFLDEFAKVAECKKVPCIIMGGTL